MRLVNVNTLELQEFFEKDVPPYFILSHRWGEGEVSYKEYRKKHNTDSSGYRKIVKACEFARQLSWTSSRRELGLDYPKECVSWLWVDTCCIDKRSSAELSEAINSMYAWYRDAEVCIAYLADVAAVHVDDLSGTRKHRFEKSEWFFRGWTLQELLAPEIVVLCDSTWEVLGHKCHSLRKCVCWVEDRGFLKFGPLVVQELSAITGIPTQHLYHPLHDYNRPHNAPSVAQRMSWAAMRRTTRTEDEAYCLLGIFDINMPLLYGEGNKAFVRLQEEILKSSRDQSVFAWRAPSELAWSLRTGIRTEVVELGFGLFALSPKWFASSTHVYFRSSEEFSPTQPFAVTSEGLHATIDLIRAEAEKRAFQAESPATESILYALPLNCRRSEVVTGKVFRYRDWPYVTLLLSPDSGEAIEDIARGHFLRRVHADDLGERAKSSVDHRKANVRVFLPQVSGLHMYLRLFQQM